MRIVVGIPIYKNVLNLFERVSLAQVVKILGCYEIVFIAPQSLDFNYGKDCKIERFPDGYFQNVNSYSRLLLSIDFYKRFGLYDYLLIYQLDAFVFSNRLEEFCSLNVDYVGAPVKGGDWDTLNCRVGNGGLSLRKISKTTQLLTEKQDLLHDKQFEGLFYKGEDLFFSYCGARIDIDYQVPSVRIAAEFSVEFDIAHGYRDIAKRGLPFGCHWWHRLNYQYWRPIIERYGYELPELSTVEYDNTLVADHRKRLNYCLIRGLKENKRSLVLSLCRLFDKKRSYSIWGAGRDGKNIMNILRHLPVKIDKIYDIHAKENDSLQGIPVIMPEDDRIKEGESVIIISTRHYEQEIASHLESLRMKNGSDFQFARDLYTRMYDIMENNWK